MIGQGVCSFSSHSCAAGRMTSAAKPWTHSRMSFWSWVSAIENAASWLAEAVIASTAASAASVLRSCEGGATVGVVADIWRDLLGMGRAGAPAAADKASCEALVRPSSQAKNEENSKTG